MNPGTIKVELWNVDMAASVHVSIADADNELDVEA